MYGKLLLLLLSIVASACSGPAVDNQIARGKQVFSEHCASCHALNEGVVIVGPSLFGVASRAGSSGDARSNLIAAIKSPGLDIAEGFQDLMPPDFAAKLAPEDFEALLAYLLTLE